MPKASGYMRFKEGYSGAFFSTEVPPLQYINVVYLQMNLQGAINFVTHVNGTQYIGKIIPTLKRGIYPFTLEYSGGVAHGWIAGQDLGTLPAPTIELPFMTRNADYYPNWWDVPEYQTQAAATGIGAAISGVAGYVLKPIDPVISALIGAGLGGGAGYGLAYLATTGIPGIPIPTFGATPEKIASVRTATLGKYQITG